MFLINLLAGSFPTVVAAGLAGSLAVVATGLAALLFLLLSVSSGSHLNIYTLKKKRFLLKIYIFKNY